MNPSALAGLFYKAYVRRDVDAALRLIDRIGRAVIRNFRSPWPQQDWWHDEAFNAYLRRFGELEGHNMERRWMVYQLGRLARDVPGDTAECGVFHGAGSYLMCAGNRGTNKTHHAFDSFEGLSTPGPDDGSFWSKGDMAAPLDGVMRALAEFDAVKYHRGWIPERFLDVESLKFSFVHVDVDLEQPTRDSIEFFYPRLSEGALFVCDDYGFSTCPGATRTIDQFLEDKPEKMIALSAGGGFFLKGRSVAPAGPGGTFR